MLADTFIAICDWFKVKYRNLYIMFFVCVYARIFRVNSNIIEAKVTTVDDKNVTTDYKMTHLIMCFYYFEYNYSTYKLQKWVENWYRIKPRFAEITYRYCDEIIVKNIDLVEDKWIISKMKYETEESVDIPDAGNISLSNF